MCFSLLHDVFLVEPRIGMMWVKNLSAGARSLFNLPRSGLVQQSNQTDGCSFALFPFRFAPFYGKSANEQPPFIAAL